MIVEKNDFGKLEKVSRKSNATQKEMVWRLATCNQIARYISYKHNAIRLDRQSNQLKPIQLQTNK